MRKTYTFELLVVIPQGAEYPLDAILNELSNLPSDWITAVREQ